MTVKYLTPTNAFGLRRSRTMERLLKTPSFIMKNKPLTPHCCKTEQLVMLVILLLVNAHRYERRSGLFELPLLRGLPYAAKSE